MLQFALPDNELGFPNATNAFKRITQSVISRYNSLIVTKGHKAAPLYQSPIITSDVQAFSDADKARMSALGALVLVPITVAASTTASLPDAAFSAANLSTYNVLFYKKYTDQNNIATIASTPVLHILSIDVQGAEYAILDGRFGMPTVLGNPQKSMFAFDTNYGILYSTRSLDSGCKIRYVPRLPRVTASQSGSVILYAPITLDLLSYDEEFKQFLALEVAIQYCKITHKPHQTLLLLRDEYGILLNSRNTFAQMTPQ